MEAAVSADSLGTGTPTMAAQLPADVAKHSGRAALRHKVGDEWRDISYDELGEAVREIALGLVELGIESRDRVAILCHTRPEWTFANFGILTAGATSVSIYQTNSPEECHYVLDHSGAVHGFGHAPAIGAGPYWPGGDVARGARAIVAEMQARLALAGAGLCRLARARTQERASDLAARRPQESRRARLHRSHCANSARSRRYRAGNR